MDNKTYEHPPCSRLCTDQGMYALQSFQTLSAYTTYSAPWWARLAWFFPSVSFQRNVCCLINGVMQDGFYDLCCNGWERTTDTEYFRSVPVLYGMWCPIPGPEPGTAVKIKEKFVQSTWSAPQGSVDVSRITGFWTILSCPQLCGLGQLHQAWVLPCSNREKSEGPRICT